jgi:hypothetical protein
VDKKDITQRRKQAVSKPEKPVVSVRVDASFNDWLEARAIKDDRLKSWILTKLLQLGRERYDKLMGRNGRK